MKTLKTMKTIKTMKTVKNYENYENFENHENCKLIMTSMDTIKGIMIPLIVITLIAFHYILFDQVKL